MTRSIFARFLNFGEISYGLAVRDRTFFFFVSAHLELKKCSNLTDFFTCCYDSRIVLDFKGVTFDVFKDLRIGYFWQKVQKKKKKKCIFQTTRRTERSLDLKGAENQ